MHLWQGWGCVYVLMVYMQLKSYCSGISKVTVIELSGREVSRAVVEHWVQEPSCRLLQLVLLSKHRATDCPPSCCFVGTEPTDLLCSSVVLCEQQGRDVSYLHSPLLWRTAEEKQSWAVLGRLFSSYSRITGNAFACFVFGRGFCFPPKDSISRRFGHLLYELKWKLLLFMEISWHRVALQACMSGFFPFPSRYYDLLRCPERSRWHSVIAHCILNKDSTPCLHQCVCFSNLIISNNRSCADPWVWGVWCCVFVWGSVSV